MRLAYDLYSSFAFGDMLLCYVNHDKQLAMTLIPASLRDEIGEHRTILKDTLPCRNLAECVHYDFPSYCFESMAQLKISGDAYADQHAPGNSMRNSASCGRFAVISQERRGDTVETVFEDDRCLQLIHTARFIDSANCFEMQTEVRNNSGKPQTLEYLASFSLGLLSPFQTGAGEGRLKVHRFRSFWSAETRPESRTLEELGLEMSWQGAGVRTLRFGQRSSMPVKEFFPFLALEDSEKGVFWGATLCAPGSWQMELSRLGDFLNISGGQIDREFGAWHLKLNAGERFKGPAAAVCCVEGPRDALLQRLCAYSGESTQSIHDKNDTLPIIFNEWCTTWGNPTPEKLLPVAKRLAGTPIQYFVLDAGWFAGSGSWNSAIGDWDVVSDYYPLGIKAFCDELRSLGFKPGIWFEFENAQTNAGIFAEHPEYFLTLDGAPIKVGTRVFLDFTRQDVWRYLDKKMIAMLRENQFDYLKVDYNAAVPFGVDASDGFCPAEMLRRHMDAACRYFEHLRRELPDLVIEICASGGHRISPYWVRYADVVSGTDAHEGVEIPIIAAQESLLIPARSGQVWATLRRDDDMKRLHYSLSASLMARMVLSGNPDLLDDNQFSVVKNAMNFYEKIRPVLREGGASVEIHPAGSWNKPEGYQIFRRRSSSETLVIIHTFAGSPAQICCRHSGTLLGVFKDDATTIRQEQDNWIVEPSGDFTGCAILLSNQ